MPTGQHRISMNSSEPLKTFTVPRQEIWPASIWRFLSSCSRSWKLIANWCFPQDSAALATEIAAWPLRSRLSAAHITYQAPARLITWNRKSFMQRTSYLRFRALPTRPTRNCMANLYPASVAWIYCSIVAGSQRGYCGPSVHSDVLRGYTPRS